MKVIDPYPLGLAWPRVKHAAPARDAVPEHTAAEERAERVHRPRPRRAKAPASR